VTFPDPQIASRPQVSAYDIGAYEVGGGDTSPPGIFNPTPGSAVSGTTQATVGVSTTEVATCRYSTTPGTSYDDMVNTFAGGGGSSHTAVVGSVTYSDNFNRTDESPLASGWTKSDSDGSAMRIVSNQVLGTNNFTRNSSYYGSTLADDQKASATVYGYSIGPMVRVQGGQSDIVGYAMYASEAMDAVKIDKFKAGGTVETIDIASIAVSSGDILELQAQGCTISGKKNGSPISGLSVTDCEIARGYPGLASWYNTQAADGWSASGISPLSDGQVYHYYTRCADGSGNKNLSDYDLSLTVGSGGGAVHTLGSFELQGAIQ
jgi:hypothetical protein